MSLKKAEEYLKKFSKDKDIIVLKDSTATVELAAKALGVIPARIAKTLSFKTDKAVILIVTAGDTKIDNKKYKAFFGCKAKMLTPEQVTEYIGHNVGGVCPFGVKDGVDVYCDISMQRFSTVFPACGSSNSAIELDCDGLFKISNAKEWVDICKIVEPAA